MAQKNWNVSEAKAHLSDMLREARHTPQIIENRGRETAVVVSIEAWRDLERLRKQSERGNGIREFLRVCEEIRNEGGAEIDTGNRTNRPSPFSTEDEY